MLTSKQTPQSLQAKKQRWSKAAKQLESLAAEKEEEYR